jgi:hypothetical protein
VKDSTKNYGIIYEEANGTIRNCVVATNMIGDMYDVDIGIWDNSFVTINLYAIHNCGRIGVFYYDGCGGGVYDGIIEGQVYNNENYVNYGIEIAGNEIFNRDNLYSSPKWSSADILIDGWLGLFAVPSSRVMIEKNEIHDNYYGIEVVANPLSYAHYNNIYNNRGYGVIQGSDYVGNNATSMQHLTDGGHETGPHHGTSWMYMESPYGPHYGSGDSVSDYVLYDPWLEYPWSAPPPTIKVEPPICQMQMLNKTFSINITINDLNVGYKAIGVQFRLCHNKTLLEVVNVTEGPFLKDGAWNLHGTYFIYFVGSYTPYDPSIVAGVLLYPNATGRWNAFPSGNGVIATITFKSIYQERGLEKPPLACDLKLVETLIVGDDGTKIPPTFGMDLQDSPNL